MSNQIFEWFRDFSFPKIRYSLFGIYIFDWKCWFINLQYDLKSIYLPGIQSARHLSLGQIQERWNPQLFTPNQTNIFIPGPNSNISLIDTKEHVRHFVLFLWNTFPLPPWSGCNIWSISKNYRYLAAYIRISPLLIPYFERVCEGLYERRIVRLSKIK